MRGQIGPARTFVWGSGKQRRTYTGPGASPHDLSRRDRGAVGAAAPGPLRPWAPIARTDVTEVVRGMAILFPSTPRIASIGWRTPVVIVLCGCLISMLSFGP